MDPLLVVIISFGLLFVVLASLGNGLSVTTQSIRTPLKGRGQSNIMLLLANLRPFSLWDNLRLLRAAARRSQAKRAVS